MTPRENDVYRHPHTGEEVIIDHVTDAEVALRVTDGQGGLLAAYRVTRDGWESLRARHELQLTNREDPIP